MTATCKVQIIQDGDQQSFIIPPEISLSATEFFLKEEDGKLILEPVKKLGLLETLVALDDLDEDFPDVDRGLLPLDDINL